MSITSLELRVLEALAVGLSQKQAAATLGMSDHGVADAVKRIHKKLHMHTTAGAVGVAYRTGLLPRKLDNARI